MRQLLPKTATQKVNDFAIDFLFVPFFLFFVVFLEITGAVASFDDCEIVTVNLLVSYVYSIFKIIQVLDAV